MKKGKFVLLLCLLAENVCIYSYNEISSIRSLSEAEQHLNAIGEKSIVLFDIDETLIIAKDKIRMSKFTKKEPGRSIMAEFESSLTAPFEQVWSKVLTQAKIQLLELCVTNIINELKRRNIKTFGLTKIRVGAYGFIKSLEERRYIQLQELGIDFSSSSIKDYIFQELAQKHGQHPIFYKGIIFTNDHDKGLVLEAFIHFMQVSYRWKPNVIVCFDDSLENLVSISQSCLKLGIDFQGFHYVAADNLPITFNPNIATFQLNYFLKNEHWLSEEEASRFM